MTQQAVVLDQEDRFWHRYESGSNSFWTVIMYLLAGLYLYGTYGNNPAALRGWSLAALLALLAVYFVAYHLLFLREPWPHSPSRSAIYGVVQLTVIVLLHQFDRGFVGLGIPVAAHLMVALPSRWWVLAISPLLIVIYLGWGVWDALRGDELVEVFWIMLQPLMWIAVFASITLLARKSEELTETVGELRRAKAELERSAAQAEELAVLRERTRLARDMHDSLGHALVVVNVKLEAAQRLYNVDPQRGAAELEATRDLIRDSMVDLRRSLSNLRAPLPDHHDLPAALARLAAEVRSRSNLDVQFEPPKVFADLSPPTSEALWRVAREGLTNVERHAAGSTVDLLLHADDHAVTLRIADDGSGIALVDLRRTGHYGIVGMRERVEAVGGRFAIERREGGGTSVVAIVPLAEVPSPHAATQDDVE